MMMQGIRKAGQGLFGKIVIAIMFGFLIMSFAIWGVGDIFRGSMPFVVAMIVCLIILTIFPQIATSLARL